MKQSKKMKWIVGLSGVALSSFVLGQLDNGSEGQTAFNEQTISQHISKEEKELLKLDWTDFQFPETASENKSDRKSKRS